MTKRKTKTDKLITALESGRALTSEQLARRTGLKNVSATIDRLRQRGEVIYTLQNYEGKSVYVG